MVERNGSIDDDRWAACARLPNFGPGDPPHGISREML
jgi:hypothetical protein